MLVSLHIENYALIDHLDITFEDGFSVITGETGAGKSILLGAIGLLLGQRADLRMIKAGAQRCVIEATFDLCAYNFKEYFDSHDLDFDGKECIIRRELTATGKSRAFINDTPTALTYLKELGDQLIDIHSQHQNLLLRGESFQLQTIDAVAQVDEMLSKYQSLYKTYRQAQTDYENAKAQADKDREEQDYLSFQLSQLSEANLAEDEEEELEQALSTLEHAEEIKTALYQSADMLEGDSNGLIPQLHEAKRRMESIAPVYAAADSLTERLESCYIELRDIAQEIANHAEQVDYDPEELERASQRMALIHDLKQKFHCPDIPSLLALQEDLSQRVSLIENCDAMLAQKLQHIKELEKQLETLAQTLSKARAKAAQQTEKEMHQRLAPLGMPNVRFQVELTQTPNLTPTGRDKVSFLFSANMGTPLQPLSQVASGGEISRLMLCLKALTSGIVRLPTIIFDEIDTGVSGHIAERMADTMRTMGDGGRQVIAITHLPQIAARGANHYRVFKTETAEQTTTHIVQLTSEERIEELARMLSGSTLTQAALDNARALLSGQ